MTPAAKAARWEFFITRDKRQGLIDHRPDGAIVTHEFDSYGAALDFKKAILKSEKQAAKSKP